MIRNLLILPDGTELFSGQPGQAAIGEVTLTTQVNSAQELTPGAVCAAMAEVTVLSAGEFSLAAGSEVTLVHVDDQGQRTQVGIFLAEQPRRKSAHVYELTAYDRVCLLDKDLSGWLGTLQGWPYPVHSFAKMVCAACGLELVTEELPNGEYLINAFGADSVTGRQLLAWVGQLSGRFCRATPTGELEFAWYRPSGVVLTPGGEHYYYQGSLRYEDYVTAPIEKVQLRLTAGDVGAVYPDMDQANTLILSGNYLLTQNSAQALEPVARTLWEQLQDLAYTPGSVEVPAWVPVEAGDTVQIQDTAGREITLYVMQKELCGQRAVLSATGSARRDSTSARNQAGYRALTGRVLELQLDIQGLQAENRDAAGNLASVKLDLEGIATQVQQQQTTDTGLQQQLTRMEQTEQALTLQVQQLCQQGATRLETTMGYTFDDTGLQIRRSGQEIETLIDHTGMQVSRLGQNVLQATAEGVKAVDITVKNYLMLGNHARLEDYTDGLDTARTACFWR